ncbi:unnamed protein product [Clavelina lepadiformis]|uniref:EFHB C-terminal EF-hand domain-containing protein n=1 Tax=Clavelina lepadiformis TaxID=159417 RepID=A0ABP0FP78_CLALP
MVNINYIGLSVAAKWANMSSSEAKFSEQNVTGKVFCHSGSTMRECLQPNLSSEKTEVEKSSVEKYNSFAHKITHGVSSQSSFPASLLLNPKPKTLFQQRLLEKNEQCYASRTFPLGKPAIQKVAGNQVRPDNTQMYGIVTEMDEDAGEIINPRKSREQIEEEAKAGHAQYIVTHHAYDVGEMCDRNYDWSKSNPKTTRFGIETPHYNDGKNMMKTLQWSSQKSVQKCTTIVSKRADDFRERTQPQLGKVHDPIADTLNVNPNHTFGIMIRPDKYNVGDLLHMRSPKNFLLGKERERGVLANVRQHLKKTNYHNFNDLRSAFRHYDYDNTGYLDAQKIWDACWKFNLPIDDDLLSSLMRYCSVDSNEKAEGDECKLDYEKFVNFLNWKDKILPPISLQCEKENEKKPEANDKDVQRLCKQIDKAMTNSITSSSSINAVVGGVDTKQDPSYGVPTVRFDLPAPRCRRISDRTNYGDESDAYGLVNPSMYTRHGVYERDFFEPRSREEIRTIFEEIGVEMSEEAFEKIWGLAVQWTGVDVENVASVEAFRTILDKINAASIQEEEKEKQFVKRPTCIRIVTNR